LKHTTYHLSKLLVIIPLPKSVSLFGNFSSNKYQLKMLILDCTLFSRWLIHSQVPHTTYISIYCLFNLLFYFFNSTTSNVK
jgi:hypothetical protein